MESYIRPQNVSYDELDPQVLADTIQTVLYIKDNSQVSIDGLRNLESLAHDREYGIKLVQPDTLDRLLNLISTFQSSESTQIRQGASRVIGSALWNNPEAMEVIKQSSLVKKLLNALEGEPDSGVRASLIFALSAASAGDITDFLENNGSQLLLRIFLIDKPEVQGKCATFVEDNLANTAVNADELKLWCELFQNVLVKQHSLYVTSEKVFSALMYLSCES
jgi:Nucleotide exchange factor SIL1